MKNVYKIVTGLFVAIFFYHSTVGQNIGQPTSIGTSKSILDGLKQKSNAANLRVSNSSINLKISSTQTIEGKINFKKSESNSEYIVGEIYNAPSSSFFIQVNENTIDGHIILKDSKQAFKYTSDKDGNAYVTKVDINSLICVDYEHTPPQKQKALNAPMAAAIAPALLNLQSLPGAPGCVLLDFDGYNMPAGNYWNGGNAINAAPSGMSDADVQQHFDVVAEDYRPFNVNITTSESVFNSYPRTRRMRCVVTPTNTAAPGAGGVAYIGSFNWDNDVPCWVFITSGKAGGDASSHEIGHCFDLQHDGRSNPDEGYFLGIDGTAWAPIMGAGYYRPIVQFSKGEYRYAKNDVPGVLQDDIASISSSKFGVGFRPDEYGDNTASAANLDYNSGGAINQKYGVITNEADWDFFTFNTGGGNVVINANTVSRDQNLHIIIRLYNSAGTEIGSAYDANTFNMNASLNVNLAAGKYYVSIDGAGAGDPAYGGYSAYGSLGSYWITGTIPPANNVNPTTGIVTVFKDCNYSGFSGGLSVGDYTLAQLNALGVLNDDISSLKITQGFKAILYNDDNFTGASVTITSDNTCLVQTGDNWNDRVTSVRIRPNGDPNLSGIYVILNRNSNLALDVNGGTGATADGAGFIQSTPHENTNQQFRFDHVGDGAYKVVAMHSGKVMDVDGIKQDNGAKVQQWTYFGTFNQEFIAVSTGDGFYKLIAKHSGKVVEVGGFSTASGAGVQQWENVNQTSGMWKLNRPAPVNGNGDGLAGNYFNGMNFETPRFARKDANVNFSWGNGSPNAAVNADQYSARWTGQIQPRYSGTYTFYINSDNGRRVWVNNQLIIDKWIDDWNVEYTGTIVLTRGEKYDIKVEYFENNGGADIKLEWSSPIQGREVIPTAQLYSNPFPTVSVSSPSTTYTSPANITLNASASDDGSVAKVDFYNGNTLISSDNSSPYSINWNNIGGGSYKITAIANDNKGAFTISNQVTLVVTGSTVNQAPTVSITGPANNSNYTAPASVAITANASDTDGNITTVEFYNGTKLLGIDNSSPFSYNWTNVAAGTYSITAKATDNSGASTTSSSITVVVKNPVTNACTGVSQYTENGGYVAGSIVQNAGSKYSCKPYPYTGWCNGAAWAYAPGTGSYWTDAWDLVGPCTGSASRTAALSSEEYTNVFGPNPTSDVVKINLNSTSRISVYNTIGVEVISSVEVSANGTLDLSALPVGVYLMRIDTGSEVISKNVVKK